MPGARFLSNGSIEGESGDRMIDAVLANTMRLAISREFLARMMEGRSLNRVTVGVADNACRYSFT